MTDMQASYYNSWISIMNKPIFRLYCTWHFFEALKKNQSKITNRDKRKEVMDRMYGMASENDETKFRDKLNGFLNDDDPELHEFKEYFRNQYACNEDTKNAGPIATGCLPV